MNVSLTRELEAFVMRKVKSGRYGSASEVVRESLRLLEENDLTQRFSFRTTEKLEEKLLEGIESGPAKKMTAKDWANLRRRVKAGIKKSQA